MIPRISCQVARHVFIRENATNDSFGMEILLASRKNPCGGTGLIK
jgi:hypothetical protein